VRFRGSGSSFAARHPTAVRHGAPKQALADEGIRARFAELGFLKLNLDHVQLRDFFQSETAKFKKVIDTAGIKVE